MTNATMAIVIGCAVGILVAQIASHLVLVRIAEALERMNVRLALIIRSDP